jgi:RNA polymerase sigma-70 factor (ECF subfamily)
MGVPVSDQNPFTDFVGRIRAGDEQAALELVRRYEPLIRREVRLSLEDRRLARLFDSMDVCQSVLKSFFVRTAAGEYDLDTPEQLQRLLVAMARNKLASAASRQRRQRRDHRRVAAGGAEQLDTVAAAAPTPSEVAAGRELLERFRRALGDEERQLADLRGQGLAWADIAARLGGTAQARRMQLARAVERAARELGLDEDDA